MVSTRRARRRVTVGFALGAVLPVAAVAGIVAAGHTPTAAAEPPHPVSSSSCADLGGTVDPAPLCHVRTVTPAYVLDFRFPVDYPDQPPVLGYLTRQRDDLVAYAAKFPPGRTRSMRYELDVTSKTYTSGTPAAGTRSLVLVIGDDTGVHPVTLYQAFDYDVAKGVPITFDTLFRPGTDPLSVLNPIIERTFGPLPSGAPGVDAYRNFAITDDAVIFFFDQDGLLPHVDGPRTVAVPRTELAALLALP